MSLNPAFPAAALDAVILDLDGTMVDTLGDFVAAIDLMLADIGLPLVPPEAIAKMVGKGSEHLIYSVLSHSMGLDSVAKYAIKKDSSSAAALYTAASQSYQRHYLAVNGQQALVYPGVRAGLQALRNRGLVLACVTNKPTAFALPLLAAKELAGFFSQVFGGDAFERKKPDPLPLLKTCAALGFAPERTLMVGDSSNDALAARAAGCPVALVSYGYNHGQPVQAGDADIVIDSLAELAALLPARVCAVG